MSETPPAPVAARIDDLDARLLHELLDDARVGVLELSRRLGVARATVQARLDKLVANGVIEAFALRVDPAAMGFPVTAFVTMEIRQGFDADILAHLRGVAEILEVHTITGPGDLMCRVVARSNADLQRVLQRVVGVDGVTRTSTIIALTTDVAPRVRPLIDAAVFG